MPQREAAEATHRSGSPADAVRDPPAAEERFRDLANVNNSTAQHSYDWIRATPRDACIMDNQTFTTALWYKFGIPLHTSSSTCVMCNKATMDVHGDHALVCTFGGGKTKRHNAVVDILFRVVSRIRPMERKEKQYLLADRFLCAKASRYFNSADADQLPEKIAET